VAGAYLGVAAIPSLTGVLATYAGLHVIGPSLVATAAVRLLLQEIARPPSLGE
jgi:hypothetical protein